MFIANSTEETAITHEVDAAKPSSPKRTKSKPKAKTFSDLSNLISNWRPSDVKASRRLLSGEIMNLLEDRGFTYIRACIPSIIVEGQFPIDLMHYHSEQDVYEFLTRMLWMHQEYGKALGIMLDVGDDEIMADIKEACGSLLMSEKDCLVFFA
jgi:hypothetical protein